MRKYGYFCFIGKPVLKLPEIIPKHVLNISPIQQSSVERDTPREYADKEVQSTCGKQLVEEGYSSSSALKMRQVSWYVHILSGRNRYLANI